MFYYLCILFMFVFNERLFKHTYMKGEFTKYELEVLIGIFGYTKEQVYYFRKASKDTEKFIANIIKIRNERRNINS